MSSQDIEGHGGKVPEKIIGLVSIVNLGGTYAEE